MDNRRDNFTICELNKLYESYREKYHAYSCDAEMDHKIVDSFKWGMERVNIAIYKKNEELAQSKDPCFY
jgi:hypothetical protein